MNKKLKITEVKGRPMLNWIGKKTIDITNNYPAQLSETFNTSKTIELNYNKLIKNWHNLLFHGDNIEVLVNLLQCGFRAKIDLIYIDPPFDSKADYIRKVELRGRGAAEKLVGEGHNTLEQKQYFDIWQNDDYLQFMYERLILLKELLSAKGSIYLHCDWHKSHHLRCLLDEVFGEENFRNELCWKKLNSPKSQSGGFGNQKDNIFLYSKSDRSIFNTVYVDLDEKSLRPYSKDDKDGKGRYRLIEIEAQGIQKNQNRKTFEFMGHTAPYLYKKETLEKWAEEDRIYISSTGRPSKKQYLSEVEGLIVSDIWMDKKVAPIQSAEKKGYPTQKPEALLERIIKASSNEDSIIFDCFMGSGTTQAVAQKLNRRWIGADINKGAIQTAAKRIQKIIKQPTSLFDKTHASFAHFKVNDYDLQILRTEAIELAIAKLNIAKINDNFFDDKLGNKLVKIIEFNHPFSLFDLEDITEELKKRPQEERNIKVVCLGLREDAKAKITEYNKKTNINQIEIIDLTAKEFMIHEPCQAKITYRNNKIVIKNFISPTIIKRLTNDDGVLTTPIKDFRAMIDCVLIDNDYNNDVFSVVYSDIPKNKKELITGEYTIKPQGKVAIKIIDMLGEEYIEILN